MIIAQDGAGADPGQLTASQTALLIAVPVLLGSLARIPMGMLTDRFGGRNRMLALAALGAYPLDQR